MINSNVPLDFTVGEDGQPRWKVRGADTWYPFSKNTNWRLTLSFTLGCRRDDYSSQDRSASRTLIITYYNGNVTFGGTYTTQVNTEHKMVGDSHHWVAYITSMQVTKFEIL